MNASLYSALLPLWEGFDEAFHYAYVETLWQTGRLPVLGRALVPNDVFRTFGLVPFSHVVHRWIPGSITFDEWFSLPQAEKEQRRRDLELIRNEPATSSRPNYQAHQPPLAYLTLALLDWPMSRAPIAIRVLILRLFAAVFSTILLYLGATALFRTLQIPELFANAALFTVFCSQMLYATIAHVANDWLAVGVSALCIAAIAEFVNKPDRRSALIAAFWLAVGLLSKAYFLVFAPFALAVTVTLVWKRRTQVKTVLGGTVLVLALAGPWYIRNVILYGNVGGTHEAFDGIGIRQALAAAPQIDWVATAGFLARGSIWTGNGSFTSFSRSTLNIVLGLVAAALAAWGFRRRAIQPAERIVFATIVLFSIAIAYATCVLFAHDNGAIPGASPWYAPVLLTPVMALAYLGMSPWNRFGPVLAGLTITIWTWILIATWTVKLFPMYSGAGAAPMRLHDVWNWYVHEAAAHASDLSLLALAPAPLLYAGMLVSLTLSIVLSAAIIRDLTARVNV
ncbi:MAG TPA: hypothetical protein VEU96_24200 [Bryobacteraceae bacterium]|nr:hypothetical protein [Bryobacteraceae bacterium]